MDLACLIRLCRSVMQIKTENQKHHKAQNVVLTCSLFSRGWEPPSPVFAIEMELLPFICDEITKHGGKAQPETSLKCSTSTSSEICIAEDPYS